ncbi:MAG: hypothetical protein Q7R52_04905 [archaeon]|nr:hypothetical protein [archaeon]
MVEFLKSLGNLLMISVAILGAIAIFFKTLDPLSSAILLSIILFVGIVSLTIYQINKIEKKVDLIEQKFIRTNELIDMKGDIQALKILINKRK